MKSVKYLLSLFLTFSICTFIYSQNEILGKVVQQIDRQSLEFVNITLCTQDSVLLAGLKSNKDGTFNPHCRTTSKIS